VDAARLKAIPLFARLSEEELRRVAPLAAVRELPEGAVLSNGREELLLIDAGTAEVWCDERHVADLAAGDYFTTGPTVVATSPVRVVALDIDAARTLALA
jgi:signal-transduction protein with cAMP-binding, CBS, and nucleotidyltransferase domain